MHITNNKSKSCEDEADPATSQETNPYTVDPSNVGARAYGR